MTGKSEEYERAVARVTMLRGRGTGGVLLEVAEKRVKVLAERFEIQELPGVLLKEDGFRLLTEAGDAISVETPPPTRKGKKPRRKL